MPGIFQNDRFALAGFEHGQGRRIDPEDWPTDDLELDFFNAGLRQAKAAGGASAERVLCVKSSPSGGCEPGISLHPANWR